MKALALASLFFYAGISFAAPAAPDALNAEMAGKILALSLHCAELETPHYYDGFPGAKPGFAKATHPAFYGCFDWHSSVHGHWAMMHIVDRYPELPAAKEAVRILNDHLAKEKIAKELAYFQGENNGMFERPYGWAWFLRLAEEAAKSKHPDSAQWRLALQPLEEHIVKASQAYLAKLNEPVRYGFHGNTAFALTHLWDYAEAKTNLPLQAAVRDSAKLLYGKDQHCPLDYEPSSGDFISPCFTEADLMRRVLPAPEFKRWLNAFLPALKEKQLTPVLPVDSKDYILGHLVGLTFEKAAAMRGVGETLGAKDPRREKLLRAAKAQAAAGWGRFFESGYGATHWIGSFALIYYDRVGLKDK